MKLTQDLHVHSTFSDGKSTMEENLAQAEARELATLGMVDHVRTDTEWVPSFSEAVEAMRQTTALELLCGVEAKILDTEGRLDIPDALPGVDYIAVADHQLPWIEETLHPAAARTQIEEGSLTAEAVVEALCSGMLGAMEFDANLLMVHPMSILPKMGLSEADVPESLVREIGRSAVRNSVLFEINERWRCPSLRIAQLLAEEGVSFASSTDSHRAATIGRYDYVIEIATELGLATEELNRNRNGSLVRP